MMRKQIILFAIFISFGSSAVVTFEKDSFQKKHNESNPPRYQLNLDLSPCDRWKEIAEQADPKLFENGIKALFEKILPTPEMFHMAQVIASKLDRYFQEPYSDEMRCLSEASGIPLGDVILGNLIYELTAVTNSSAKACTSIVSMDKEGKIIHGRNLDFYDTDFLKNVTIVVDFQRNNETVYTGVTFIGYIGVQTGVRHGAFSLSGNSRFYGSLYLNLLSILDGAQTAFFTARRVLDESSDYPSALNQLTNTPTAAPVYFILGGLSKSEGALVVRNGMDVAVVKHLRDYLKHNWFLVETNYDPWVDPPKSDDRRDVAIKAMLKIGEDKMDADNLYQVLSTQPVLNNETVYTTIMSASNSSLFDTRIRNDSSTDN